MVLMSARSIFNAAEFLMHASRTARFSDPEIHYRGRARDLPAREKFLLGIRGSLLFLRLASALLNNSLRLGNYGRILRK